MSDALGLTYGLFKKRRPNFSINHDEYEYLTGLFTHCLTLVVGQHNLSEEI